MAQGEHPNSQANLQQGGGNNRGKGRKFYMGVVFRDCFTEDDVKELAAFYLAGMRDTSLSMKDRQKAAEVILKYLVAEHEDVGQDTEGSIQTHDDFKRLFTQLAGAVGAVSPDPQEPVL